MDREKLNKIMDQGNLRYACIFKMGENGASIFSGLPGSF